MDEQIEMRDILADRLGHRSIGDTADYAVASLRAQWALEEGLIPCPACEAGKYMGCDMCGDFGVLNPDGTPIAKENNNGEE